MSFFSCVFAKKAVPLAQILHVQKQFYIFIKEYKMRKILLTVFALCALFMQAETYNYLVFTNTEGTTTAFSVNNLTLTVNGSNLQVTNDEGTVDLVLTGLQAMQFSKTTGLEGLEDILEADKPIDVFTPLGMKIGRYNNLLEAAGSLGKGVYVITNGKHSQTIILQ